MESQTVSDWRKNGLKGVKPFDTILTPLVNKRTITKIITPISTCYFHSFSNIDVALPTWCPNNADIQILEPELQVNGSYVISENNRNIEVVSISYGSGTGLVNRIEYPRVGFEEKLQPNNFIWLIVVLVNGEISKVHQAPEESYNIKVEEVGGNKVFNVDFEYYDCSWKIDLNGNVIEKSEFW